MASNPTDQPPTGAVTGGPSSQASPRAPITRLDSLSRRGGRGSTPLKVKPKVPPQRNHLDLQRAARLDQVTLPAGHSSVNASAAPRGGPLGRGGRGGVSRSYAMPPPLRTGEGMASGPFGAGSVITSVSTSKYRRLSLSHMMGAVAYTSRVSDENHRQIRRKLLPPTSNERGWAC